MKLKLPPWLYHSVYKMYIVCMLKIMHRQPYWKFSFMLSIFGIQKIIFSIITINHIVLYQVVASNRCIRTKVLLKVLLITWSYDHWPYLCSCTSSPSFWQHFFIFTNTILPSVCFLVCNPFLSTKIEGLGGGTKIFTTTESAQKMTTESA